MNIALKNTLLSLLLSLCLFPMTAQRDSTLISGVVYDYETREALKNASFKYNGEFIDISADGKFQLYVKPNDSLAFKYLGYKDYIIVVPKDLDQVSYISGVFLNKADIDASEVLVVPREYKVESLATYDPMQLQSMMQNAQHNIAVAAYQATQPYEWDAAANQKHSMAMKDLELEYKSAIAPHQMVGISTSTTIQNPGKNLKIDNFGEKDFKHFSPLTPTEEFYIKTLFEAGLQEVKQEKTTK
ncbi:MAG: hypothetical protein PF444_06370 [Bacteroidales bacterium]|jgi:hypothetical protein|nr:hypothetical protein [Bacteroidales bacterium]